MRVQKWLWLGVLGWFSLALQAGDVAKSSRFHFVTAQDAERDLAGAMQRSTGVAAWMWSDKYVYSPGETLRLWWTVKTYNDSYPYTLVAYRVNNQSGVKTFLPNGTSAPTDIFGNTPAQGFRIAKLSDAAKAVLIGANGVFPAAAGLIPNEPGMHTITLEIRDYTGQQPLKTLYWKIGVVASIVDVQGDILSNTTWVNTNAYRVRGLVYVKGATLTIQPGTFVIGMPGSQPPSAIVVSRSGKLVAEGTRQRPIIMTSSQPFGQRKPGDWGGLILLGRAPANWPAGEGPIEGLPDSPDSRYGGNDPNHDCGRLRYVRVEFAGAEFQPNNEVNAFTWGACGKNSVADHLQAHYGFDDQFEWFGGNMDSKFLVGTYGRDDFIDGQIGYTGRIQYVVGVSNADNSNRGIEMDNNETDFGLRPLSRPEMYNMTFVGTGDKYTTGFDEGVSVAAVWLRRGTGGFYNNLLLYNWVGWGVEIRDTATLANLDTGEIRMDGVLMWDNGKASGRANTLQGQVTATALPFFQGTRGQARNVVVADPKMKRPLEYSDPDFTLMPDSPAWGAGFIKPPDNGFFDQNVNFTGAFGSENWTEEWATFIQEADLRIP